MKEYCQRSESFFNDLMTHVTKTEEGITDFHSRELNTSLHNYIESLINVLKIPWEEIADILEYPEEDSNMYLDQHNHLKSYLEHATIQIQNLHCLLQHAVQVENTTEEPEREHKASKGIDLKLIFFSFFSSPIPNANNVTTISDGKQFLAWIILFCAQFSCCLHARWSQSVDFQHRRKSHNFWTTGKLCESSNQIMSMLALCMGYNGINDLMNSCSSEWLQNMLHYHKCFCGDGKQEAELVHSLKSNDILKHIFKEVICHLQHPYLSAIVDKVIPLCLSLIDDYKMESKLVGVACLSHVTSNVNPTELKWFKETLIKTMFDSLVFREYPFLSLLVPCLLETLFLVEPAPMSSSYVNSQTVVLVKHVPNCFRLHDSDLLSDKYGVLISYFIKESSRIVKNGSSHERKLQLIYLRAIESLVKKMGLRTVVYFKSLLPVLFEYLKIIMDSFSNSSEGNLLCCVLTITETLVLYCWPRFDLLYIWCFLSVYLSWNHFFSLKE